LKTFYILRHAKAEPSNSTIEDIDRNLAVRGREACETVGKYMKAKQYAPEFVLCSSANRTRETFELVMKAARLTPAHEFAKSIYMATADEILHQLHAADDNFKSLMVVGHNPGMHHLALIMAQPMSSSLHATLELKYPTAALTVLRFADHYWKDILPGSGELLDFMTPAD